MIQSVVFKKRAQTFLILFILLIKSYFLFSVYKNQNLYGPVIFKELVSIGDSEHYLMIAKNIHDHRIFSDNNSTHLSESAVWRPPIWPFIMSFFFILTNNIFIILVLKVLLETFFIVLIYRKLIKAKIVNNYLLLLLLPLEPFYQKYSITFLSESVTALFIFYAFYLFISLREEKRTNILIPIILSITILCHPVSIFFIGTLFGAYCLLNIKSKTKTIFLHLIIFIILTIAWPLRNQIVYNKGVFLTASQGSSLSKGWNERVVEDFNNVNGDLADANLNLKYVSQIEIDAVSNSIIDQSNLYKKATKIFFDQLPFNEKAAMVWIKLKSNFNPFPEVEKKGSLDQLAIIFRILYLIIFMQSIYFLIKKRKLFWTDIRVRIALFTFSIFVGQLIMASALYTGLRFNAIYSLSLLASFFIFNYDYVIHKVKNKYKLKE
tara:strand:- start:7389 stop:8693 length:1305 start_codon:yes stop_codon:yes gene_type:complete